MLKKILIPATAILTICFTPVTLFAEEGAQLTGSGLKGHWLLAEAEFPYEASFNSNGDCHVTMSRYEGNNDLCIHPDGTFETEVDTGEVTSFSVFRSEDTILYYGYENNTCVGIFFLDGEDSDKGYILDMDADLFLSEEKLISVDDQEVFDYEIIDNTLCYFNEHSVRALDIISHTPDLLVCQDTPSSSEAGNSDSCLTLFIKADCIEAEK